MRKEEQGHYIVDLSADENDRGDNVFALYSVELRSSLNNISAMLEMLSEKSLDEESESMVQILDYAFRRLMRTLRSMLDLNEINNGNFETDNSEIDMEGLIESVVCDYREALDDKGLVLETEISGPEKLFYGDGPKISYLLDVLLSNAIKYSSGGEISISFRSGENLAISVADQGRGISEELENNIFSFPESAGDPEYAKHIRRGFSLAIAKKIVLGLGGSIDFSPNRPKGAVFSINLPLADTAGKSSGPKSLDIARALKRVLLVEDDPINQLYMETALRKIGMDPVLADDGMEALDIIASGPLPDLIILDIALPKMNGLEVAEYLKKENKYKAIPIVGVTAYSSRRDIERMTRAGFEKILIKPVDAKRIISAISQLGRKK